MWQCHLISPRLSLSLLCHVSFYFLLSLDFARFSSFPLRFAPPLESTQPLALEHHCAMLHPSPMSIVVLCPSPSSIATPPSTLCPSPSCSAPHPRCAPPQRSAPRPQHAPPLALNAPPLALALDALHLDAMPLALELCLPTLCPLPQPLPALRPRCNPSLRGRKHPLPVPISPLARI